MQKNSNTKARIGIDKIKQHNRGHAIVSVLQLLYTTYVHIAYCMVTHCLATNCTVIQCNRHLQCHLPLCAVCYVRTIATMNTESHCNVRNSKIFSKELFTNQYTNRYALYMQIYCTCKHILHVHANK